MPLERRKWITRNMLRNEPETLFVFGDNLVRVGFGGQAKEMRGEPNAVGLPTKRTPQQYLEPHDLFEVISVTNSDVERLLKHLRSGGRIVWPTDGIGTGLAQLEKRAPNIMNFYDGVLRRLEDTQ